MRRLIVAGLVFIPGIALAAPRTLSELADFALVYINAGIGIAFALAIVIYFFGVATSIPKIKKDDAAHLRTQIVWGLLALFIMFSVWGILALFVMVSVWGIINIVRDTFDLDQNSTINVPCITGTNSQPCAGQPNN